VEGMQAAGIIPVVKHFPGHGDTSVDSHVDLPRVEAPIATLALRELRPFEAAIQAGVPVVMTCHVVVPALDPDPDRPATLSRPMVTGLLREKMGFQGVVVTDALEMAGATSRGSFGEVAVQAIGEALRSGRLTQERISASIARIRRLRGGSAAVPREWSTTVEREARNLITGEELERIAEGAIRVLRQGAGGVPLRPPIDVLEVNRPESRAPIADLIRAHGVTAREWGPDPETWPRRIEGSSLLTVAARGSVSPEHEALGRLWLQRYPETVTVASLNP